MELLSAAGRNGDKRVRLKGSAEPPCRSAPLRADPDEVGRRCAPRGRAFRLLRQRPLLTRALMGRPPASGGLHTSMLTTEPTSARLTKLSRGERIESGERGERPEAG
jgi:hypothetical protein